MTMPPPAAAPSEDLVILGAGGFSREIAWLVDQINQHGARWNLLGFLDDNPAKHGMSVDGYPVLGLISSAADYPAAKFVAGVASYKNRAGRQNVLARLGFECGRFATLVSPLACVAPTATLGHGTVVLSAAVIAPGARLGHHVLVSPACVIGHDAELEDFVTMAAGVTVSGSTLVGTGAYLGAHSVLRDGLQVGAGALVGIGSVVKRNVAAGVTVFGNPAEPVGRLREDRRR